ncbi:MAG: sugar phosphorylase [Alkalispirochaeta sp.]
MDSVVTQLTQAVYPDHPDLPARIEKLIEQYRPTIAAHREHFSAAAGDFPLSADDAILITYGDMFQGPDSPPLEYLYRFLDEEVEETVTGVHILPFSPYSSDDGFSVVDYRTVNQQLGSWEQIERIAAEFRLMVDLVLNHCSAQSRWFQGFLHDESPYHAYFITADPEEDYRMVVRPRALPLLTPVETDHGTEHVWTTFSDDQIDLNWKNPDVLLEMLDVFLGYLARGAQIVRLDAIAYLWKEIGHSCIHHPHTHRIVKLFRRVMELVDPAGILITETNVPHRDNVSYFGSGDEAHMVYNFSLPPLLLDATIRGTTEHLRTWVAGLEDPGPGTSFFNFCASHDGIGLTPTHGILSDEQRESLAQVVRERGGRVSYKATAEGEIPYELNINYLSAATDAALPNPQRAEQFLGTQAVMLSLAGVPGIYIHSLIGSENWQEGVDRTGANRAINREKLDFETVVAELSDDTSLRGMVFSGYKQLLRARAGHAAFHPRSPQHVMESDDRLLVLLRGPYREGSDTGEESILAIHNLSSDVVEFRDRRDRYPWADTGVLRELVTDDLVYPTNEGALFSLELEPYEVLWLQF